MKFNRQLIYHQILKPENLFNVEFKLVSYILIQYFYDTNN